MRVFKTKGFVRFARKEGIKDAMLTEAIVCAESGLIDADLGGGLIKQRVARPGAGKRGGFRTFAAYRAGKKAVFLFGFAKNDLANVSREDERDLRDYGALLLALGDNEIKRMIEGGELSEVEYGKANEEIPQRNR